MGQNELQTSNVDTPTLKMSCIHRSYIGCSKRGFSHNRSLSESHSFTPYRKNKIIRDIKFMILQAPKHSPHQVGESSLFQKVLHTQLSKLSP
jgi:hypothetical protein